MGNIHSPLLHCTAEVHTRPMTAQTGIFDLFVRDSEALARLLRISLISVLAQLLEVQL